MAQFINSPSIIKAAGTKEKIIKEFFGRVNSKTDRSKHRTYDKP